MEEARAHLSNSWDLEVWAAGTLQMHLSLRLDKGHSADQPLTALDELSASWIARIQALSDMLPARRLTI